MPSVHGIHAVTIWPRAECVTFFSVRFGVVLTAGFHKKQTHNSRAKGTLVKVRNYENCAVSFCGTGITACTEYYTVEEHDEEGYYAQENY